MQSPVEGSSKVSSEKKSSPLKFAWDKFKEIGIVPAAVVGKSPKTVVSARVSDPTHARHQEYQTLVTKRGLGMPQRIAISRDAVSEKTERSQAAGRLLTQGLHESSIHKIQDFGRFAAFSVAFLLGA